MLVSQSCNCGCHNGTAKHVVPCSCNRPRPNVVVMFCVSAVDEFGRKFNYNRAIANENLEDLVNPVAWYQYVGGRMIADILQRMGSVAYAEWECKVRELNFGTSTEV